MTTAHWQKSSLSGTFNSFDSFSSSDSSPSEEPSASGSFFQALSYFYCELILLYLIIKIKRIFCYLIRRTEILIIFVLSVNSFQFSIYTLRNSFFVSDVHSSLFESISSSGMFAVQHFNTPFLLHSRGP